MSVRHLNFRDMVYLVAVNQHRQFGKAAAASGLSQPALSERIRHIERSLDCTLFERNRRGVIITPAGERVVAYAQSILDIADELDASSAGTGQPLTGRLRVGLIATLGPYLVPHLLEPVAMAYPDLELIVSEGLTDQLLGWLGSGQLDLVLAALPVEVAGLDTKPAFFEPFYLAAPRSLPIGHRSNVTPSMLDGEDMILLEEGHCLSGQALQVCPARKRGNSERLQSTSVETLRSMVAMGSKYTLLPWLAVGDEPTLPELINYRPLDGKTGRDIALVYRRSWRNREDLEAFHSLLVDNLPDGCDVL